MKSILNCTLLIGIVLLCITSSPLSVDAICTHKQSCRMTQAEQAMWDCLNQMQWYETIRESIRYADGAAR
jgi:hypothetical protein